MNYVVEVVPDMFKLAGLYGEVTYTDQVIKIAGDISLARQFNVFVHELTHAIIFESGDWIDDDRNEEWVRKFSNTLTQVALDNGWMVGGIGAMEPK